MDKINEYVDDNFSYDNMILMYTYKHSIDCVMSLRV